MAKKELTITENKTAGETLGTIPGPWDAGWTEYLVGLLRKNERDKDRPNNFGLRRLFHQFVGEIVGNSVYVHQSPNPGNQNRAVVEVNIRYRPLRGNMSEGVSMGERTISDVADCYTGNTKSPFCNFATATAITMAENRCLRKALNISVISSEESETPEDMEGEIDRDDMATVLSDNQKHRISQMAKKLNINLAVMLDGMDLELLTYNQAQKTLTQLVAYMRGPNEKGGEKIPDDLLIK